MKRKNFFTGSVFQFYIPEINKYSFCKFFDFKHLSNFHGLLAQVFDAFSEEEENNIETLTYRDWLSGPRSMYKWPNLRKETQWKSLGLLSSANDDVVPDFKGARAGVTIVKDESQLSRWYVVRNLTQYIDCAYSHVCHLETRHLTTTRLLQIRTGMEYCRINQLKVEDFYDLSKTVERQEYYLMINVPIYNSIPKDIRGKATCFPQKIE
jgi:hypothetical protein